MKIGYQDIGELRDASPESIKRAIVVPAKEALSLLRQATGGNLTIRDNQYAAIVTLGAGAQSMTSATEYTLQNPLKTKPVGFSPIMAANSSGTSLEISGTSLNLSRADGLIGITCEFFGITSGYIGEAIRSAVPFASAITLANATNTNLASIPLANGDWNASAIVSFNGAITGSLLQISISDTSATIQSSGDGEAESPTMPTTNSDQTLTVPDFKIQPATTTTYYLVARANFSVGTAKAYGRIIARRQTIQQTAGIVTGILWGG